MNIKRIISLLLVLVLSLGVCVGLASCGEPETEPCTSHVDNDKDGVCDTEGCTEAVTPSEPEKTAYTVTVLDDEGNAVVGATVEILVGSVRSDILTTNTEGKVSAEFDVQGTGTVVARATVKTVPAGYKTPSSAERFSAGETELTVTVEKDRRVAHTVKLVDSEGNALNIAGATVMICQQTCQTPVDTDENGVAVITFEPLPTYLKVKITNFDYDTSDNNDIETLDALVGYVYAKDTDAEGYIHFELSEFDAAAPVLEIVLLK
ncbi:MAG: Ig-like domain-containing protein [Clostridia bacterium]|nr:Ig-like domain-containing protein [Clostridia bacterium]